MWKQVEKQGMERAKKGKPFKTKLLGNFLLKNGGQSQR